VSGQIINLNDKPRPPRESYVYIGRRQWCGKELFESSPWANYFSVKRYGRAEALRRYEQKLRKKLRANPELLADLLELDGKILACWCAPEACHGDVLLRLISEELEDG
jgi:hypothetical protein